jgi:hypothetical protein
MMSRILVAVLLAVVVMLSGVAGTCLAQEGFGIGPPGMRFGDQPQVVSAQTAGYGDYGNGYGPGSCDTCGNGGGPGCDNNCGPRIYDPCWVGPCMDWKTIGWYSCFRDHCHHGAGRACRKAACCETCY